MDLPSVKKFFDSSYSQDASYQGYFSTGSKANEGRAINAIDISRHLIQYPTIAIKIALMTVAASIALLAVCVIGTVALVYYLKNHPQKEERKELAIVVFKITAMGMCRIGHLLTKEIFKIVFVIGDLLGIMFPEIGRKSRQLEKTYDDKLIRLIGQIYTISEFLEFLGIDNDFSSPKEALEVLGLDENATQQEVKDKYYALCKEIHPDKNKDSKDPEQMAEINKAYHYLMKNKLLDSSENSDKQIPAKRNISDID